MTKMLKKIATVTVATAYLSTAALAIDDGPRMYWNLPQDLNVLMTYAWSVHGNSVSPSGALFQEDANVDMNILLFGYNRTFDIFGHTGIFTAIIPAGNAQASIPIDLPIGDGNTIPIRTEQASRGIGDLYFQGTFNIFGGEAVTMEEYMTSYKQTTLLSALIGLSTPTGEYDSNRVINMGLNRWAGRFALPFVQTIGDWKPGSITTFEVTPGMWIYGDNDDFKGLKLEQDILYTIEAHLTQDLTPAAFVSLDYMYQTGGETTLGGVNQDDSQNIDTVGLSVGYMLNPSTQFVFRYNAALSPKPDEADIGIMEFNLNYIF